MHFDRVLRIAFCGAALAVAASIPTASAQQQQQQEKQSGPSTPIADDGSEVSVVRRGDVDVSPPFPGTGRELRLGEKDDALASPTSRVEEQDIERRLLRAKPIRPATPEQGANPETVIGVDQRRRVTPTTTYPARATVMILFSDGASEFLCSGFLISKDTVATAGHCVASETGGGFFSPATYRIFPGRDGTRRPYGSCRARRLFSVTGWVSQNRDDFDYGAIKLNCNIGNTTGWYGYAVANPPKGSPTLTEGYPGDKPLTQWRSRDEVRLVQLRRVFYQNDTAGGQSGSPLWLANAKCNPCAIAVHAYGVGGTGVFAHNNHGTRVNRQVFDNLSSWRGR